MPDKTIAEILRDKAQIAVDLPVAGERVYVRAVCGWEMLSAGLKPLMLSAEELGDLSQKDAEERWAEIVTQARYVAVAVGIHPKYCLHETIRKDMVCVRDLDDQDVVAIYSKAIEKTDSRVQGLYYGINQRAFDLEDHLPLFADQKEMMAWLYELCHFHFPGLSPFDLLDAPEWKIGVLQEMVREGTLKFIKDNPPPPDAGAK